MLLWNVASADTIFPIAESPPAAAFVILPAPNGMTDAELVAINDTLLANSHILELTMEVGRKNDTAESSLGLKVYGTSPKRLAGLRAYQTIVMLCSLPQLTRMSPFSYFFILVFLH